MTKKRPSRKRLLIRHLRKLNLISQATSLCCSSCSASSAVNQGEVDVEAKQEEEEGIGEHKETRQVKTAQLLE